MKLPFRFRIALLSAAISGLVLIGFGVAAYLVVHRQKIDGLDTEIRSLGMRHPGLLGNRGNFQRLDENLHFIFGEDHRDRVALMVRDAGGDILHTTPGWPGDLDNSLPEFKLEDDSDAVRSLPTQEEGGLRGDRGWRGGGRGMGPPHSQVTFTKVPRFLTVTTDSSEWRLGVLGTDDTTLVIGLRMDGVRNELQRLRNSFLVALPVALALVGLGGWVVAGRALRPIKAIARTAEQVTARGLKQRIPRSVEDPEIGRVIEILNQMMDRLEASFHQANRFTADASHELRTPLAIMQGELESAIQEAAPDSRVQRVLGNLLEETQRLKTITNGLLLLARADAGQLKPSLEPVDFTAMVSEVLEDAETLAEDKQLSFEVTLTPDLTVDGDPALLRTAVMNLAVNAVKYNEPGGKFVVGLDEEAGQAVLRISNGGDGIPEGQQDKVFTRFHRVSAARDRIVDGVGLGLSLSREIIRAHGGELSLQESRPGWTCFALSLGLAGGDR